MSIAGLLHQTAGWAADRPAISKDGVDLLTYGELASRSARLAEGLVSAFGLEPGDRLAVVMENDEHYLEVLFACWYAGLVAVPVNMRLHPREIAHVLDDSGSRLCVTSTRLEATARTACGPRPVVVAGSPPYRDLLAGREHVPVSCDPDDPAWLFYTSGTTGRPKGATLTHRNLTAASLSLLADAGPFEPGGALLHLAPLSHAGGLFGLALTTRAYRHVIPTSASFDLDEVCALLRRYERACLFGVPTMLGRLIDHPSFSGDALEHVERVFYGGAPMYVEDLKRLMGRVGAHRLWQGYGQGEAPVTITHLPGWLHDGSDQALASVGIARTGVEVAVVGRDGRSLPPDEVGEVVVRGDVVMKGYWNNPAATAEAIQDGWLHTGDLGAMDARGLLTLKDRSKDVVISGGSNIYPREVEEVLLTHPDLTAVAVVGRPDPEWGETVVAFVVPSGDVTATDLDRFCQDHLARYKRPRDYVFVEALPTSTVGKVLKTELRELLTTTH